MVLIVSEVSELLIQMIRNIKSDIEMTAVGHNRNCKQKFGGLWVTHTGFMCPIVLFIYTFIQQELIATSGFYQDLLLPDVNYSH